MSQERTPGQVAYEAYCNSQGVPPLDWSQTEHQVAWEAAASAVSAEVGQRWDEATLKVITDAAHYQASTYELQRQLSEQAAEIERLRSRLEAIAARRSSRWDRLSKLTGALREARAQRDAAEARAAESQPTS